MAGAAHPGTIGEGGTKVEWCRFKNNINDGLEGLFLLNQVSQ